MRDPYKVQIINECLNGMARDRYCLTRLKGDNTHAINIDENGLKLLRAYYNGQIKAAAVSRL